MSPSEQKLIDLGQETTDAAIAALVSGPAGEGQRLAANVFAERFGRLVAGVARRWCGRKRESDIEAAVQDGWVVAFQSAGKFDPSRGVPLAGYLVACVKGAVLNGSRGERRHQRKLADDRWATLDCNGPIPKTEGEEASAAPDPYGEVIQRQEAAAQERIHQSVIAFVASLPTPLERAIAAQLYEHNRVERKRLADEHDLTVDEVDRARGAVLRAMKDMAAQLGVKARGHKAEVIRLATDPRQVASNSMVKRTA